MLNLYTLKAEYISESYLVPDDFSGFIINDYYDVLWYKNGNWHREDGPAIIESNGNCEWRQNLDLHRFSGPAKLTDNLELWYLYGTEYTKEQHNLFVDILKLKGLKQ